MLQNLIVIPARLHSTRLPKKLLLAETGKPLVQHTYEAACQSECADRVIVAVDSEEMANAVKSFGGEWHMTSPDHPSGTDRVAEVNAELQAQFVVNVQGDEPDISPTAIDKVFRRLLGEERADVATLATPIGSEQKLNDPNCVKVVCDRMGRALYFSRARIPHAREWSPEFLKQGHFLQHVGLYGYRRKFLGEVKSLSPSPLEKLEALEQLRFLHEGYQIFVDVISESAIGIDTEADYREFVDRFRRPPEA